MDGLYGSKLNRQKKRTKRSKSPEKIGFEPKKPYLTATVNTKAQYDACISQGIHEVYFENVIRRNQNQYKEKDGQVLVGGYGGIYHYKNSNPFITDYSLNVVNSKACYELYKLGAKRVTLSYELNKKQIDDLIQAYKKKMTACQPLK